MMVAASPTKRNGPASKANALVPEPVLGQEALLAAQTVLICSAAFFLADVSKCATWGVGGIGLPGGAGLVP